MTINCKGDLIDITDPKIMGVLNCTPDSFYDGGKYKNETEIINQVQKMLVDGATFIDIGAYSSRPGALQVNEEEELKRIIPIVTLVLKEFPECKISIDTFRSKVAEACIQEGAALINDISAGNLDLNMMSVVAKHQVPYIMMHMKGTPQDMQQNTNYTNLLTDILSYFSEKIATAHDKKINDLIIDPGFGFSKTIAQNYELMQKLELLKNTKKPLLVGISRKSMIYKILKTDAKNALNGTTSLNTIALLKGANILRVHDVKEASECIAIVQQLKYINT
ncbi:dihydropteroate synthase [Cellulophaga baltica]|uniref:Dihydropteroate synthase n=1 Tax=Cellulophaga baltica TaxID=76594 RepID=A0A1G7E7G4_9FLAO|nr:dihydropteroate synthase [Cellulophaga baltica]AIY11781.1 dihydropteroate synthase [Cellulophaga baltica NN016038]SDE59658.1 dihydropteroate synthase [Cellulophaga baltica]